MTTKLNKIIILIFTIMLVSCADQIVTECGIEESGITVSASFTAIQNKVFNSTCAVAGCHVNNSVSPDLSAGQAYNNIKNIMSSNPPMLYVYPAHSDSSYLINKLRGINIQGERMPRNRQPLSASVIDSIAAWIDNGALNN